MNRRTGALILAAMLSCMSLRAMDSPIAREGACVVYGNARFTVLTPRLIRMEWDAEGCFCDESTLTVVNRDLDVPKFKVSRMKNRLKIKTSDVELVYTGNEPFSSDNLKVRFSMGIWTPGMKDTLNLKGTARTLDGCKGFSQVSHNDPMEDGILSRSGWAVIDDSKNLLLRKNDSKWGEWVAPRTQSDNIDWYLFAYGHDYKSALADYTAIAGKIPLPPKYAFGYWWCRYWQYSDKEFLDLGKQLRSFDIPIDVMIVDMDWHETWGLTIRNPKKDEFDLAIGWTGYTWQKELFPEPELFLKQLHEDINVKVSLNLHPASGIQPYEECYDRFIADYTGRTDNYDGARGYVDSAGNKQPSPFRMSQMEWADAYFNSVIHPIEKLGVDFWWLDWQQFLTSKYIDGLSNTFWLNHTFFKDKQMFSSTRPMIYHRWGGLGSHRYQLGFSGDCFDTWDVLAFLPYFTSTASNVCYGYWGHDIGGHKQLKPHYTDPELYTRWIQYGVFTPIFKSHSTKSKYMEKRFWYFPKYFDSMRDAIKLRYRLSPYIYTAAWQAYDTGVSMCRPMYYDYPEEEESYTMNEQFMFGNDILATVICSPVDAKTKLASRQMWFPEGNGWYDMTTGATYEGGTHRTLHYTISENPYFVKSGAIIPLAPEGIKTLQEEAPGIEFLVIPGAGKSATVLYEDDGNAKDYASKHALTRVSKTASDTKVVLNVGPREGSYEGMLDSRDVRALFDGILPPASVSVNGTPVPYNREYAKATSPCWGYDGHELRVVVTVPDADPSVGCDIVLEYNKEADNSVVDGKKGIIKRVEALSTEAKYATNSYDAFLMVPASFLKVSQCGRLIEADVDKAAELLSGIDLDAVVKDFQKMGNAASSFLPVFESHVTNF